MATSYAITVSTRNKEDFDYKAFQEWAKTLDKEPIFAEHENNNWHALLETPREKRSIDRSIWDTFIRQEGNIKKHALKIKPAKNIKLWIGYMAHEGVERMLPLRPDTEHHYKLCYEEYKTANTEPEMEQNFPTLVYHKITYEQLPYLIEHTAKTNGLHPHADFQDCMEILVKSRYAVHIFSKAQLTRVKASLKLLAQ